MACGAEAPAPPLGSREFASLFGALGPFEARPHLAVACSGGADSMALALLLHDWARSAGGSLTALTVDHRLRPESAAEAGRVAEWMRARGIAHEVLVRPDTPLTGNLQAEARRIRYALMSEWCRRRGVLHLALAHHLEDQAETLLLRLARGSGVDGVVQQDWKQYSISLLASNVCMWLATFAIVSVQGLLPANPDGIESMEPTLAFNTISSFTTNTNLQHYSGETGLSYFSQMFVVSFLQFVGSGWHTSGDALLANTSAALAREHETDVLDYLTTLAN